MLLPWQRPRHAQRILPGTSRNSSTGPSCQLTSSLLKQERQWVQIQASILCPVYARCYSWLSQCLYFYRHLRKLFTSIDCSLTDRNVSFFHMKYVFHVKYMAYGRVVICLWPIAISCNIGLHCSQILTTETTKLWKFPHNYHPDFWPVFHGGRLSDILRGLSPKLMPGVHWT